MGPDGGFILSDIDQYGQCTDRQNLKMTPSCKPATAFESVLSQGGKVESDERDNMYECNRAKSTRDILKN